MSIKTEMLHGVVWSAIEKYSGLLVQLLITAVLARLLTPTDFGVIAIATVITTFFNMFTDMGIGAAIVQNQTLTREDLRSLFSFSVYAGVILAVLFFFSSYLISSFYDNALLLPICQLLSLNLLFAAWNMVPNALIRKAKRFKFIAVRSFALLVVCGILSVSVALVGGGVYSLLITPILSSLAIFLVNYRQYPIKFSLSVRKKSLAKVFSFSIFQFLFSFVNYFSRNLDKLILGKYYSMSDLGYYEKSYRLMLLPMNYVTNVVTPVMHPILTTLQDDYAQLADKYNKILRLLLVISFPLGAFLYFSADDIIVVVFGSQWMAAVPVFQILSISLPLQMVLSTTGSIYQAANQTRWLFYTGLINTAITVVGFILAAIFFRDIQAMAWAWDITLLINALDSFSILYLLVLKQSLRPLLQSFGYPALSAFIISVLLFLVDKLELAFVLDGVVNLLISFALLLVSLQLTKVYDIKKFIQSRIK